MKPSRLFVWHGLALAWFVFIVSSACRLRLSDPEKTPMEIPNYGGPWKFLTVLNLLLQVVMFGVSLLGDVFILMKKQRITKSLLLPFRDLLFGSLAFPASVFVATCFWMLYLYDRQLVYPKSLDAVIPVWVNHAMHSSILPFALIELCVTPRRYPSKGTRLSLLVFGILGYIAWSVNIYSVTGRWVYPCFDVLSPLGVAALFLGSAVIAALYCQMGAFLCRMIWGDNVVLFDRKSQ